MKATSQQADALGQTLSQQLLAVRQQRASLLLAACQQPAGSLLAGGPDATEDQGDQHYVRVHSDAHGHRTKVVLY